MMNLHRRFTVTHLVVKTFSVGTKFWQIIAQLMRLPANVMILIAKWTIRRRKKRLKNVASRYRERTHSVLQQMQTFDRLTSDRKAELLAAHASLLEDYQHLLAFDSRLKAYRAPGAAVLVLTVTYMQTRLARRKQKWQSLQKIIERIDGDTFYWDLLLWVVMPVAYGEELVGDLNEEYLDRRSTDGEARAKTWYRYQVARTLKDCLWNRIERLAAIGTIVDLLDRWFRK